MRILTPERVATSSVLVGAGADEIDQLDFRLGADEGVLINEVEGHLIHGATAADVTHHFAQMLSLNADHTATDIMTISDSTDIDSPFVYLHRSNWHQGADDGAGGGLGAIASSFQRKSFHDLSPTERPKSNDILVHIVDAGASLTGTAILLVRYQLVQFTLAELGVLNAFRRF